MEPHRLRRWKTRSDPGRLDFYTCARPGRSKGANHRVDDKVVRKWAKGLPQSSEEKGLAVISLLGCKPDGTSEYSFYRFCGQWENSEDHKKEQSFERRLEEILQSRKLKVIEHPTKDFEQIPLETLEAVKADVKSLLQQGITVVLVDSGGETRIKQVCRHLEFVEDSRTL